MAGRAGTVPRYGALAREEIDGCLTISQFIPFPDELSMSERKVYDEKNGGGGSSGSEDAKAPASIATGGGWADLPPELVRRVGQLQGNPRSLARMERACKSWRKIIIEGDGAVDMGDTPCLWRELALRKFPRLVSIVNVLTGTGSASGAVHSWKALYRTNAEAKSRCEGGTYFNTSEYRPSSSWNDYVITVEFRRYGKDELLFVTSARGDRTSPLWNQAVELDDEHQDVYNHKIICKGSVDPELSSRLGVGPFSQENLRNITARVAVTRLSDLSVVEIVSVSYDDDAGPWDADGNLRFSDFYDESIFLPVGIITKSRNGKPAHLFSHTLRVKFRLTPSNGVVILTFQHWESSDGDSGSWGSMTKAEIMLYLETLCPWP